MTVQERNELVSKWEKLAFWVVYRLARLGRLKRIPLEDANQEATFALINAIDRYDADRENSCWQNYLITCISRHLVAVNQREEKEVTRHAREISRSISAKEEVFSSLDCDDLLRLTKKLPQEQHELLRDSYGLEGAARKSLAQMGERLGLTHQMMSLRRQEAIASLREKFGVGT